VVRIGDEFDALGNRDDVRSVKKLRSARFIWLLLVVNLAILVIALMIAALCCRRVAGVTQYVTSGPYTYLPGARTSYSTPLTRLVQRRRKNEQIGLPSFLLYHLY